MPTKILTSFLGGKPWATSALILRNKNGRKTCQLIRGWSEWQLWHDVRDVTWWWLLERSHRPDPSSWTTHQSLQTTRTRQATRSSIEPTTRASCSNKCERAITTDHVSHTCKGVPVIKRRYWLLYSLTTMDKTDFSFLIRCASSMIKYRQLNCLNAPFSRIAIS